MKKLAILLAVALTASFSALAQPFGPPPDGFPGGRPPGFGPDRQELSSEEKKAIGAATTEKMKSYLELNEKQIKTLGKINKRFADVVGEEKKAGGTLGRPIYGDKSGPNYDTPGRPHPKKGNLEASDRPTPSEGFRPGPGAPEFGPVSFDDEYLVSRRNKYVKKLGKVLSADQFKNWKSRQRPFPGVDEFL